MEESDPVSTSALPQLAETARQPLIRRIKSKAVHLYHKYEKYSELTIFGVGFIWDSFTMTRVDSLIDNIILLFYLIIIGIMIFLTLRRQCEQSLPKWIEKVEPHFLWATQFCFGGLFSSYVIFYFKSASWTRTQFFFLVLIFLWVGNEFLQHRLRNPKLLACLYCFCLFTFLAFFLPVVLARVNALIFMLAGLISLVVSLSLFSVGFRLDSGKWHANMKPSFLWMGSIFVLVNLLYFANLIPPVPLALKTAGIYHQVTRTAAGYEVKYVAPSLWRFWKMSDDPFYWSPGESAYCYTAIFAPGKVKVPVVHVWSRKTSEGWVETDRIRFDISGGREGGYRGSTRKRGIVPGEWRVEVETERGQILGGINFKAVASPTPHPPLITHLFR